MLDCLGLSVFTHVRVRLCFLCPLSRNAGPWWLGSLKRTRSSQPALQHAAELSCGESLKTASAKLSPPQQPGTFATLSSYTHVMFAVPVAEKIHITLHYIRYILVKIICTDFIYILVERIYVQIWYSSKGYKVMCVDFILVKVMCSDFIF